MSRQTWVIWICLLAAFATDAASPRVSLAASDALAGTWRGTAVYQDSRLEFSLRFSGEGDSLRAEISCRDFLLLDQPLDTLRVSGTHVRFSTPGQPSLRFDGDVDGDSLRGFATAHRSLSAARSTGPPPALRFSLARGPAEAARPYETRDAVVPSGGIRLAGTLFTPTSGASPRAGVVILQGASANLRHDDLFYADHFARAGFVVLTFDKRGNGESSGDYLAATYDTLAADAAAAVEFLRAQPGVDRQRVGVWGLAQGACIAPLVAARVPSLRFIVAVSAPGQSIGENEAFRDSVRLSSAGFDEADVLRATTLNRRLLGWLRTGEGGGELAALLREANGTAWARACSLPARLPSGAALEGWYWRGRTLDPVPWWQGVHTPVLALFGTASQMLPARAGAKAIEHNLRRGKNRDVTVYLIPSANELMRIVPLETGGKWDWPRAAPGYMESVTSWVLERSRPGFKPPSD